MSWVNAAITGGAALAGVAGNIFATNKLNKRAESYNKWMYGVSRRDALADRDFALEYQSPTAQMDRLRAAGLNPNLMYGSGVQAQSAPDVASSKIGVPDFKRPDFDFGGVAMSALQGMQARANISLTEAQTEATRVTSKQGAFDLAVKELIGGDRMMQRYISENAKLRASANKELVDYDIWFSSLFDGSDIAATVASDLDNRSYSITPNNPARVAIRAGLDRAVVDLGNARKDGDIKDAIRVVRDFEARLAREGISPNSPWYVKIVGSLLERFGILDIGDLGSQMR